MDHIGIDVHKKESPICILADGGELVERRIRTEREGFAAVLGDRPRARIVIASRHRATHSLSVEASLGHEAVVADPNFASMSLLAGTRRGLSRYGPMWMDCS